MRHRVIVIFLLLCAATVAAETNVLSSAAEINRFYAAPPCGSDGPIDITGTVNYADDGSFVLEDGTGRAWFGWFGKMPPIPHPGDVVRILGFARLDDGLEPWSFATNIQRIGKAELPRPPVVKLAHIDDRALNLSVISAEGTVIDICDDEVDPHVKFLILKDGPVRMTASIGTDRLQNLESLRDAHIQITGLFRRAIRGIRKYSGPYIQGETVRILIPPPADRFDAPDLECEFYLTPADVAALDRRKIRGTVLATWGGSSLMLAANHQRTLNIRLHGDEPLPACGTAVEVVGYPQTDRYRIHLANATWRSINAPARKDEAPCVLTARDLLRNPRGELRIATERHGALVTISGLVRNFQLADSTRKSPPSVSRIMLESERHVFPVDCSSHPELAEGIGVGDVIEVTGRCLIETDTVTSLTPFPQARGFAVLPRGKADIRILSRPPWWTPAKLLVVILALVVALIAVYVWNRALNRLAVRRGRELFKEQVAKAKTEFRVGERTRLAVELHDSLSQNLTGVALEVNAANRAVDTNAAKARRHLDMAQKTLASCRNELRNCLWDLRNDTLSENDMNEAIRHTVASQVGEIRLAIRFSVPRHRLTDNTTHAILRIVRELSVNAVRHGRATALRIAGSIEENTLRFSVADNGSGFDVDNHPGIAEGHFGLQGIKERIESLEGEMNILSSPEKGTKVTIALNIPRKEERPLQ